VKIFRKMREMVIKASPLFGSFYFWDVKEGRSPSKKYLPFPLLRGRG